MALKRQREGYDDYGGDGTAIGTAEPTYVLANANSDVNNGFAVVLRDQEITSEKVSYTKLGQAWTNVKQALDDMGTAGVASFNGRTGPVTSAAGDYTLAQLNCAARALCGNKELLAGPVQQLTVAQAKTMLGVASAHGIASLGADARVPPEQMSVGAMRVKGDFNPSTGVPALKDGTGTDGDVYIVNFTGVPSVVYNFAPAPNPARNVTLYVNDSVLYANNIWYNHTTPGVTTASNVFLTNPVFDNVQSWINVQRRADEPANMRVMGWFDPTIPAPALQNGAGTPGSMYCILDQRIGYDMGPETQGGVIHVAWNLFSHDWVVCVDNGAGWPIWIPVSNTTSQAFVQRSYAVPAHPSMSAADLPFTTTPAIYVSGSTGDGTFRSMNPHSLLLYDDVAANWYQAAINDGTVLGRSGGNVTGITVSAEGVLGNPSTGVQTIAMGLNTILGRGTTGSHVGAITVGANTVVGNTGTGLTTVGIGTAGGVCGLNGSAEIPFPSLAAALSTTGTNWNSASQMMRTRTVGTELRLEAINILSGQMVGRIAGGTTTISGLSKSDVWTLLDREVASGLAGLNASSQLTDLARLPATTAVHSIYASNASSVGTSVALDTYHAVGRLGSGIVKLPFNPNANPYGTITGLCGANSNGSLLYYAGTDVRSMTIGYVDGQNNIRPFTVRSAANSTTNDVMSYMTFGEDPTDGPANPGDYPYISIHMVPHYSNSGVDRTVGAWIVRGAGNQNQYYQQFGNIKIDREPDIADTAYAAPYLALQKCTTGNNPGQDTTRGKLFVSTGGNLYYLSPGNTLTKLADN